MSLGTFQPFPYLLSPNLCFGAENITAKEPPMSIENLYTAKQTAAVLGFKPETIRLLLISGRLKGIKLVGDEWRVRPDDLRAFIAAANSQPSAPAYRARVKRVR
jgi:excisionase family DNA binding protein